MSTFNSSDLQNTLFHPFTVTQPLLCSSFTKMGNTLFHYMAMLEKNSLLALLPIYLLLLKMYHELGSVRLALFTVALRDWNKIYYGNHAVQNRWLSSEWFQVKFYPERHDCCNDVFGSQALNLTGFSVRKRDKTSCWR